MYIYVCVCVCVYMYKNHDLIKKNIVLVKFK